MTSVTHVPFGLVVAEFAVGSFGYETDNRMLAGAAIGSLLPDIDHPRSAMGFLFYFTGIPQYLERRFGHREITHSWVFLLLVLLLSAPIALFIDTGAYLALNFGNLSHIVIDFANKRGCPLWWPARGRWVIPPVEKYRLKTGGNGEFVLCAVLWVLAAAYTPVSYIGMRSAFYRFLTRDIYGAAREARKFFPEWDLEANVRGTWRDSQVPTDYEDTFQVVAVGADNLYLAKGDAVFATGFSKGREPSFTIDRILVTKTRPVRRETTRLILNYQLIDEIAEQLPEGAIVSGSLIVGSLDEEQKEDNYTATSEEFPTISFFPHGKDAEEITVTYCPASRFRRALFERGIFVYTGNLTITTGTRPS